MWSLLCIFKIDLDIKHLNIFVDFNKQKSGQISVNFYGKKMVDHILEIPRLVVFGVKLGYYKTILHINPACNLKMINKSSFNSHVYWDTL